MYAMCSQSSGAVNQVCLWARLHSTHWFESSFDFKFFFIKDHNANPLAVASTIAHEMGHNLGMSHDDQTCGCSSSNGCIMGESIGWDWNIFLKYFSINAMTLETWTHNFYHVCFHNVNGICAHPVCWNSEPVITAYNFVIHFFHRFVLPDAFSTCSQASLQSFLQNYDSSCLLDMPNESEIYGGPVCGNAFVEKGEECDCGTVEVWKFPICGNLV